MGVDNEKRKPARKRVDSPFGKNLQRVMKENNLSLKKTAEICGLGSTVIHEWINGSQPHDMAAVLRLCKAVKCDFKWILTGEKSELGDLDLKDIFNIENDPTFSGLFLLEAKRLKRKV